MTSRELLALAVARGAGARAALLVAVAPRRARAAASRVAAASPAGGARARARRRRARRPRRPDASATGSSSTPPAGCSSRVDRRRRARERARLARVPRTATRPLGSGRAATRTYYVVLFAFWALLLAVPLAGNLGVAWLLVEATTAASALLVGFSGKPRALEAGWKYLILTSLGLGVALLGIVLLAAGDPDGGLGALSWRALPGTDAPGSETALVAYLLLLAGLAAKIGWAPVHNWLPDAHSEAPPPVSALLSRRCCRPCCSSPGARAGARARRRRATRPEAC